MFSRITADKVNEIKRETGLKLVHQDYCSPSLKCGCAVAFAITDLTKDIFETDKIISDCVERKSTFEMFEGIAEAINSDADYLCGLEYGFEDFEGAELQTENFRLGVEDGKTLRPLVDDVEYGEYY